MATTNQLFPVMRSDLIVRLLARLLVAGVEENQRELARALSVSEPSLSAAAGHAVRSGVVRARKLGRSTYLSADPDNPATAPMRELLLVTAGPAIVLARELSRVPGVEAAHIFGSWAARDAGQAGPPPEDIDVLVLGGATFGGVAEACARAAQILARPVNPIVKPATAWTTSDPFVTALRQGPTTELNLGHAPEEVVGAAARGAGRDVADPVEQPGPGHGPDRDWTAGFGIS